MGDDWSKLERDDDETVIGNRCAACQGIRAPLDLMQTDLFRN